MADNTIIQQGQFVSDGADKILTLRSNIDWIEVYNLTNIEGGTQWAGLTWTWNRGMGNDEALTTYHGAADQSVYYSSCTTGYNGAVYRGVSVIDSSDRTPGSSIATTAGTNATQPVYSTGDTSELTPGSIVRIYSTAHTNINATDFSIDTITAATSFRLANTVATAPGVIAGAGTYRLIAENRAIYDFFYPRTRVIANISQAASAVVTTLVDHGYAVGDRIEFEIPHADYGMVEIDGLTGTITAVTASTFTVDIDSSGFTAYVFPTAADYTADLAALAQPKALAKPAGVDILTGGTPFQDGDAIYVVLGTSTDAAVALGSAGGTANDVIYWRAGKSFSRATS